MCSAQVQPQPYHIAPLDAVLIGLMRASGRLIKFAGPLLPLLIAAALVICLWRTLAGAGLSRTFMLCLTVALGLAEVSLLARTRTLSFPALRALTGLCIVVGPFVTLATMGLLRQVLGLDPRDALAQTFLTPPVEEISKLLPLAGILFLSSRGRSMSLVDIVLVGFLGGLGFGFVEEMARRPNSWSEWPFHLLLMFPAEPGNWFGESVAPHGYTHALASTIIAVPIAFWWRARRAARSTWPWAVAAALTFALVVITHAELDLTRQVWRPVASLIALIGAHEALPAMAFALPPLALLTDLYDARKLRAPRWWLLPQLDWRDAPHLYSSIQRNRVERAQTMASVHGAPPWPQDYWTCTAAARIAGAPLLLAIATAGALLGADAALPGDETACLDCIGDWGLWLLSSLIWLLDAYVALLDPLVERAREALRPYRTLIETAAEFTPLGDIRGFIEGLTGRDVPTGERISPFWRLVALASVIPVLGSPLDAARAAARTNRLLDAALGLGRAADTGRAPGEWVTRARRDQLASQLQGSWSGKDFGYNRRGNILLQEYRIGTTDFDRATFDGAGNLATLGEFKGDYGRHLSAPYSWLIAKNAQRQAGRQLDIADDIGVPLEWHVPRQHLQLWKNALGPELADRITWVGW